MYPKGIYLRARKPKVCPLRKLVSSEVTSTLCNFVSSVRFVCELLSAVEADGAHLISPSLYSLSEYSVLCIFITAATRTRGMSRQTNESTKEQTEDLLL